MAIKKIRDIVYGFISLDEQETEIVNHPIFQRLRRIKQLSLTDMVYPGASHTRFEHSIGVMQMASDMFDGLILKPAASEILKEYSIKESGTDRYRKIIRLAALLHDVGHAPFSHAGEECMPFLPENHPRFKQGEKLRYEHEDYSIYIIKEKFKSLIEEHPINSNYNIKVENITALLGDESAKPIPTLLLFKGIISGQVDADRADYLLRDSIHLGVSYGLYDRNRLINSITLAKTETEAPILAIEKGGWHVAESLVIARYQMFSQVYFHKVRRIYDHHIGQAVKAILNNGCYPPPDKQKNIDKYIEYDDWLINSKIKQGKAGIHGKIILNREHYKNVFESHDIPTTEDEQRFEKLIRQFEKKEKNYFLDNAETSWYKLDKDIYVKYDDGTVDLLSKISKIVKALNENSRKKRLYVER